MMPTEQMEKAPCKSRMASRQSTMKRLPICGTRPSVPSLLRLLLQLSFHLCQFLCTADWESSQNNKAWGCRGLWLGSDRVQIDIWFFYLFTIIARGEYMHAHRRRCRRWKSWWRWCRAEVRGYLRGWEDVSECLWNLICVECERDGKQREEDRMTKRGDRASD